jgi:hypothetical protein
MLPSTGLRAQVRLLLDLRLQTCNHTKPRRTTLPTTYQAPQLQRQLLLRRGLKHTERVPEVVKSEYASQPIICTSILRRQKTDAAVKDVRITDV